MVEKKINIAFNGFGRIGRNLVRKLINEPKYNIVAINARTTIVPITILSGCLVTRLCMKPSSCVIRTVEVTGIGSGIESGIESGIDVDVIITTLYYNYD